MPFVKLASGKTVFYPTQSAANAVVSTGGATFAVQGPNAATTNGAMTGRPPSAADNTARLVPVPYQRPTTPANPPPPAAAPAPSTPPPYTGGAGQSSGGQGGMPPPGSSSDDLGGQSATHSHNGQVHQHTGGLAPHNHGNPAAPAQTATGGQLDANNPTVNGVNTGPGAGTSGGGGGGSGSQLDFREIALLQYPWLSQTPELLDAFVRAYNKFADAPNAAQLALASLRQDPAYDRYFAGNRRPDGSVRLDESTYFATIEGYGAVLARYNLSPTLFNAKFPDLISGSVSVDEFSGRASSIYTDLTSNIDAVRSFYAESYGLELSDSAIFASALDPEGLGNDVFNRRVSNAQIGGQFRQFGFRRGEDQEDQLARADYLRAQGVTAQTAARGYAQAGEDVPRLDAFANRYGAGRFSIDRYEELVFQLPGFANASNLRRNLIAREQAAFGGDTTYREDRNNAGALAGLMAR